MSPLPVEPSDLANGSMVGEYRIEAKIGEGGMGQVYRAQHPLIGKKAAVKVLAAEFARNSQVVQRLLKEAQAVNQIRHPNIVDIFSFGELPDGRPYFVMEFLEGESLETALERESLARAEVIPLLEQLCLALGAAHKAGFVHRDLKPDNLWIVRTPHQPLSLKILDFGITKSMDDSGPSLTSAGQVLGTPHYMAPEQALGRAVDARTDLYALGVILYRLVAGVLPFDDKSVNVVIVKHATQQAARPSAHRKLPALLDTIIMRCLAKDPAQRPQTADDLWMELKPALGEWAGIPLASPSLPPGPLMTGMEATILAPDPHVTIPPVERRPTGTTPQVASRRSWFVGAALAVVAVLVTAGIIILNQRSAGPMLVPAEHAFVTVDAIPSSTASVPAAAPKGLDLPTDIIGRDAGADSSARPSPSPPVKKPKNSSHEGPRPIRL